jgi:G:T-mismatch repair DNA endonuclease (very short patch repair protein)
MSLAIHGCFYFPGHWAQQGLAPRVRASYILEGFLLQCQDVHISGIAGASQRTQDLRQYGLSLP